MPHDRVILHCDCNSYFASVESIGHPEYRTVPMAVCGDPASRRGIILAKNDLAKACGIQTAETIYSARKKCPNLLLLPSHHSKYRAYCKKINAIYEQYTDQVEAFSVDESWLDVTGSLHLFGSGQQIADELRRRVREELELTISVGVSFNKVFAKLGSDYKKPDATTVITRDNFKSVLWPLPSRDLLFIGYKAADKLEKCGILTIGDIATAGRERMVAMLGKNGETAWMYANGLDEDPVKRAGERDPVKSVGNGATFHRDLVSLEDIRAGLLMLCDHVASRLRRQALYCTNLTVQIKDPSLKVISRSRQLPATHATKDLVDAAVGLVERSWKIGEPIRLLSVSAGGLTEQGAAQLSLLDDAAQRERKASLDAAVDTIRTKFGEDAVQFGALVDNDLADDGAREKKRKKEDLFTDSPRG